MQHLGLVFGMVNLHFQLGNLLIKLWYLGKLLIASVLIQPVFSHIKDS